MPEQIQQQLAELLKNINSALQTGGHVIMDQVPTALAGYIHYGIAIYTFGIALSLIIFTAGLVLLLKYGILNTKRLDEYGYWTIDRIVCTIIGASATVISFFSGVGMTAKLLLVAYSPQIWLLKEVAHLTR